MPKAAALLILMALAQPATADTLTYRIILGGSDAGTITHSQSGTSETLASDVKGTTLGVMDGSFRATSRPEGRARRYESEGRSASRTRQIATVTAQTRVTETRIAPGSEATKLSDPAAVPAGTLDPVRGFGRLVRGPGCPGPFSIYDGRRVVQVSTTQTTSDSTALVCDVAYKVIAGPGHVSPFRFTSVWIRLLFDPDGKGGARQIDLKAGPFSAQLKR